MPSWLPLLMQREQPCHRTAGMTYCGTLGQWHFVLFSDFDPAHDDGGLPENGPARLWYGLCTETPAVSVERKLLSTWASLRNEGLCRRQPLLRLYRLGGLLGAQLHQVPAREPHKTRRRPDVSLPIAASARHELKRRLIEPPRLRTRFPDPSNRFALAVHRHAFCVTCLTSRTACPA
jgi:hypothetical protein